MKNIASLSKQVPLAEQQPGVVMTNLLFVPGNDKVNRSDLQCLDILAGCLQCNPELTVCLHGYTDPRGTDEYNNVLAYCRSKNVQAALAVRGVDRARIKCCSYGSDRSIAPRGDLDAYVFERRVSVEVFS